VIEHVAAFLAVSIVVIVTPGPDTALTIRNSLLGGRRGGVFTACGVATGQAIWTLAASVGIAALLVASEPAFQALKLIGAAYLVYLGAQALRAAVRRRPTGHAPVRGSSTRVLAPWKAYRQGLISNLANPKMAVFFTSLLPQFIPAGQASFRTLLPLGLVFCFMTLVWLAAYAVAVAKAGDFLRRSRIRRLLDAVTGAALIALGLRVATERG
jgi:RhtB (resistance to homoserine/threonine) family protein